MDIKKTIGNRINTALAKRGMLQKDLANILGVTDNTISYYCSGGRSPKLEQLPMIADALNTTTDYLLGLSPNLTTDKDLEAVCKYTGLSEESISVLHKLTHPSINDLPDLTKKDIHTINNAIAKSSPNSEDVSALHKEKNEVIEAGRNEVMLPVSALDAILSNEYQSKFLHNLALFLFVDGKETFKGEKTTISLGARDCSIGFAVELDDDELVFAFLKKAENELVKLRNHIKQEIFIDEFI